MSDEIFDHRLYVDLTGDGFTDAHGSSETGLWAEHSGVAFLRNSPATAAVVGCWTWVMLFVWARGILDLNFPKYRPRL